MTTCATCKGVGWVCENHPDRPWSKKVSGGCECGAGMPCPDCNPAEDEDSPPRPPPGFKVDTDKRGPRH
jgi:hypothetical protein